MICQLTGKVHDVGEATVTVTAGALGYEVLVARYALGALDQQRGQEVTLFTLEYFEGNPAVGHLVPRLVGFLTPGDREFFRELLKVKGMGMRKALRAMSLPAAQIALAIENGDERFLAGLPEIGKRTATQIVVQLRGQLGQYAEVTRAPAVVTELTSAQRIALDILVSWGDRRADAERWIAAALESEPELKEPDAIVRAVYRMKQRAG